MTPPRRLYSALAAAAKSFPWEPARFGRIHHRSEGAGSNDPEREWQEVNDTALLVTAPGQALFHLQIRLETRPPGETRAVVLGRRLKSRSHTVPNTQRATFVSDHLDVSGYWMRPRMKDTVRADLQRRLPGLAWPRIDGNRILLGTAEPYTLLRRYLIALSAIEDAKRKSGDEQPLPFGLEASDNDAEFDAEAFADMRLIQEGRLTRINSARRQRSQRLLEEAKEYFRALDADGRLRCETCQWVPTVATEGEIVQIHHLRPLSSYRKSGERLSLRQALARLIPLCPNCHRMIESKPGGGSYTPDELKNLLL